MNIAENSRFKPPHAPPLAQPAGLLRLARIARSNLLETIPAQIYRRPIVSGRSVTPWHMVCAPEALRRVLVEAVDDYPKSRATQRLLKPAIGSSMIAAEAAEWRWQRRAAAPIFAPRKLTDMAPMMTLAAEAAARRVDRAIRDGFHGKGVLCAAALTAEAAFDVMREALLGGGRIEADLEGGLSHRQVAKGLDRFLTTIAKLSWFDLLNAPDWLPRPAELLNGDVMAETVAAVDRLIAARRRQLEAEDAAVRADLIDALLTAEDPETGRRMDDATARNNLLAFIIAGHETTALALAWSLYLLANDPPAQDRAAAEAESALGAAPAADASHASSLLYVGQVIDEAMRLFPPAAMLSRRARKADRLCGRRIEPGDVVILPIYALHRHEALWERPMRFDPENFAPAAVAARDRFAYLPFGAGPRVCIGAGFALMEAKIILATLLRRFRVSPRPGAAPPRPVLTVTLRPEGGSPLVFEPRRPAAV